MAQYGNRIYGYEHRSLSESPIHNALALVRQLPHGAVLHLLAHSRGGLVGELLARAQRIDSRGAVDLAGDGLARLSENTVGGEAFNRHDIEHFTAQSQLCGREGYAEDAARLHELSMELKTRAIRIARFVRVASPLHVLAGDCGGDSLLGWLGDCLGDIFYGGQSDLVVNCAAMAGGATRSTPVRQLLLRGPQVHHLSYFERAASATAAVQALAGDDAAWLPLAGLEHGLLARGGEVPKRREQAPIALLLPDIMGSHLQVGSNRIWFDPVNLVEGRIDRLAVGQPHIVSAGWLESSYEPFARFLAQGQEVRPFTYDWRLSLQDSAAAFLPVLDAAMHDAEQRGQPLRIVAHGMGGLVARLALRERWPRFGAIAGSRLLQVGTANQGSCAMLEVLLGRDPLVRMLASWIGWKHTQRQFLGFVRAFPGVLEMLPWPQAGDAIDYFDPATWARLAAVRLHGSIGEPAAVIGPLRFLLDLLPPDGAHGGLRSAVQALAGALPA